METLSKPRAAALYLDKAMAVGQQGKTMLALRSVAKAQGGIAAVAGKAQLAREATYNILSANGNPRLSSFLALLSAVGLRLSVKPMAGKRGKKKL